MTTAKKVRYTKAPKEVEEAIARSIPIPRDLALSGSSKEIWEYVEHSKKSKVKPSREMGKKFVDDDDLFRVNLSHNAFVTVSFTGKVTAKTKNALKSVVNSFVEAVEAAH